MADFKLVNRTGRYVGASTDTKPTDCPVGSTAYETDTKELYIFDGASWTIKDGTDATAAAQETGGKGIRGWLSGIHYVLKTTGVILKAGSAIIGKFGIDQTTDGTTNKVAATQGTHDNLNCNANLQVANADNAVGNPAYVALTGSNTGVSVSATFTRPDNATAYAALDVVGTDPATNILFENVLPTTGGSFCIAKIGLEIDVSAVPSGMSGFVLYLYDSAPTAIADNSPYNWPSADRTKRIGKILIPNPEDDGDTIYAHDIGGLFYGKLATGSTSLWGILKTIGAYTPTALTVKKISMLVLPA